MNRTSNIRKQNSSGHFSPKSPDCLPDGSVGVIRIEQKLVRSVRAGHSLQNAHSPTRKIFGMKSQKEGGFGPPRAVTPWKKNMVGTCEKFVFYYCIVFLHISLPFSQHFRHRYFVSYTVERDVMTGHSPMLWETALHIKVKPFSSSIIMIAAIFHAYLSWRLIIHAVQYNAVITVSMSA
jgi:hypothetical protein